MNYRPLTRLISMSDVPADCHLTRSANREVLVRFGEKKWPRGPVVIFLLISVGCLIAAIFGTDGSQGPPWIGYVVAALFALMGIATPLLAPWRYEARFDLMHKNWQVDRCFLRLKTSRAGTFNDLSMVELKRVEYLDDSGSFTYVSYLVAVQVRNQLAIPVFQSDQIDEARKEAVLISGELGVQLLDRSED
jgi:hypothetical protein